MSNTTTLSSNAGAALPADPSAPAPAADPRAYEEHVIQPTRGWVPVNWSELLRYRELLYFMVWRDVKVRYKQTVLGPAWAVIVPLIQSVVFTLIFGWFAGMKFEGDVPFIVQVYAGMLGWSLFQNGVTASGTSLMSQQNLLTKIYFPRLYVPLGAVGTAVVDAAIMIGVLGVLLAIFGVVPSWQVVFLPPLMLLTVVAVLGFGLVLASLTVAYRDFRYVIPVMLQTLSLMSAVQYPVQMITHLSSSLPEKITAAHGYSAPTVWLAAHVGPWIPQILAINPMFGLVVNFRAAVFGMPWHFDLLAISGAVAVLMMVGGLYFFRRMERRFADVA